jgi:hypothetical protein
MTRALLEQVLEAWDYEGPGTDGLNDAMDAIRSAIAQPEQSSTVYIQSDHLLKAMQAPFLCRVEPTQRLPDFVPLYAAPPEPEARTFAFPVESGSKPVAWLMTTPELGNRIYIDDPVEAARFAGMDNRTVTPLYMAPPAPDADEDEALRNRLAYLLAGVAVALKGPEPALTRWGYADLPEIAAKAMIELEIYRQEASHD